MVHLRTQDQDHPSHHSWKSKTVASKYLRDAPVLLSTKKIKDAHLYLKTSSHLTEKVPYIYLTDKNRILQGVVPLRRLFAHSPDTQLIHIAERDDLITVLPETFQEKAAHLAFHHNIDAIPVVDEKKKILGVLSNDTIRSILHREAREDILKLSGIHKEHLAYDDILTIPFLLAVWHRLPWLLLGLFGGILGAKVIAQFELTLTEFGTLAAFIPLIVYMGDAVGTQIEAYAIRDSALGNKLETARYFFKQFGIILCLGVILSIVAGILGLVIGVPTNVLRVIVIGLFCTMASAIVTGLCIPLLFSRLKIDPANAAGPVATTLQDILSILIYFVIATSLL